METYEQVLKIVEVALNKGDYKLCIEFLSPVIKSYPISSKEGINLRTILITALFGDNKKVDAKKFCKELLKSYDLRTRENAKYLMEIIDSPEIKTPENWNINFESNTSFKKQSINDLNPKKSNVKKKKFINTNNTPTGETKPFQKGFTFLIILILFLLIPLLSGCVKIENTLDLSELDSINNYLKVESKYNNKFPWQIKFEEKIREIIPDAEFTADQSNFSLKNKNLNLERTKEILRKIQQTAGDVAGESTDIEIKTSEKNRILFKKYIYSIDVNLQNIKVFDELELYFRIIHPNKANFYDVNNSQLEISKNLIVWNLVPGEINNLKFSFWSLNKLLIGIITSLLLILISYLLRFYRFKLGSDLPQLPSN